MRNQKIKTLPIDLDPIVLADQDCVIEGIFSSKSMQRLNKMAQSNADTVDVQIRFSHGELGLPKVTGKVGISMMLKCERCLAPIEVEVKSTINVLLRQEDMHFKDTADQYEYFEYTGKGLNLSDLIEDELILAAPLVPKHQDISQCNQDMLAWLASSKGSEQKINNPFAILKR